MVGAARRLPRVAGAFSAVVVFGSIFACASSSLGGPASMQISDNNMQNMRFDLSSNKIAVRSYTRQSLADTWTNVQRAYADLGIGLTTRRVDDHVVGNEGMSVTHTLAKRPLSTFLECGTGSGGPNADLYAVHMSVLTQLTQMRDSTVQIATLVTADATARLYGSVTATCASTGELEKQISNRALLAM